MKTWQLLIAHLLTHILLFLTSSSSQPTKNQSSNYGVDLSVLLSFRSFITSDPKQALSSWSLDPVGNGTSTAPLPDYCEWMGVACSNRRHPGHVTAIRLQGLGLAGTICRQLGNLTHLRVLNLSSNNLQGEIPGSLSGCTALHAMNLSGNFLYGSLPASLGLLSKLTSLSVSRNNLTGDIPMSFSNLTALTNLSMSSNHFYGQIPSWLGNLTSLTHLGLGQNSFSGHISPALGKMANLVTFDIRANKLEGPFPPFMFNLSSITDFSIGFNRLSGSLPLDIGFKLPKLNLFATHGNQFVGPIPASLSNASALEYLFLRENQHHGLIPRDIGMHGRFRKFSLGHNLLQTIEPRDWDFLTSLTNCSNLEILDLEQNNLQGVMPVTIANLSTELDWITIGRNKITGTIPAWLGKFHKLTKVILADNLFTGTLPLDICQIPNLQYVDLSHNRFYWQIPKSLGNITQLSNLSLSNNFLDGSIPSSLGNLTKLMSLDLSGNSLRGKIPQEILSIPSLTVLLNLSNNALSGSIPTQIGKLNSLVTIDLSLNKLSGEIPDALSSCVQLNFLYLQGNLLQGQIPKGFSSLRGLKTLDISNNNLTGPLPEFLHSFELLTYLNLSFNDLSGPVPNTGIFSNATAFLLPGNSMLCGGPPSLKLPSCPHIGFSKASKQHRRWVILFCMTGTFLEEGSNSYKRRLSTLQTGPQRNRKIQGNPEKCKKHPKPPGRNSIGSSAAPKAPSRRRRRRTTVRWEEGTPTRCRRPQDPSAAKHRNLVSLNEHGRCANSPPPPNFQPRRRRPGPPAPSPHHLQSPLPSPPRPAGAEPPEKTTSTTCTKSGTPTTSSFSPRRHGRPEKQRRSRAPDKASRPPRRRGRNGERRGSTTPYTPTPSPPSSTAPPRHAHLIYTRTHEPELPPTSRCRNGDRRQRGAAGSPARPRTYESPSESPLSTVARGTRKRECWLSHCMTGTLIFFMCSLTACYLIKTRIKRNSAGEGTCFHHGRISYAEIDAATESFSSAYLIGSGSFGNVYVGTLNLNENLCTVAIKVLNLDKRGANRSFLRECEALQKIRHRKLVKVITVCSSLDRNGDDFKALVLEFICNGNLDEWLHPNEMTNNTTFRRLSLMERLCIALDVAEALEYLHHQIEPSIVHRDIKPSNILLDDDIVAHVTDFGLAKIIHTDGCMHNGGGTGSSSLVIKGTIGYFAPEYGSGSEPSTDGDVYSYGVLLLEIFTGRRPTDSFIDGVTGLVNHVRMAYPDKLLEILDTTATYSEDTQRLIDIFLYPMFKLGLACCEDSPSHRMKMDEVAKELNTIKKACVAHMSVHQF